MFIPPHLSFNLLLQTRFSSLNMPKFKEINGKRLKSIEKYHSFVFFSKPDHEINDLFLYDLDFVLKNRDLLFFKRVIDGFEPEYSKVNPVELIFEIVERKETFKPYIDYLYEKGWGDFILQTSQNYEHGSDLLGWLHIIERDDVAQYLCSKHGYPKIIFDKKYGASNFSFHCLTFDRFERFKVAFEIYGYDKEQLKNFVLKNPIHDFESRLKIMDFLIQYNIIEDNIDTHRKFIFENAKTFKGNKLNLYIAHFNIDEKTLFENIVIDAEKNHYYAHFLNNKQNYKKIIKYGLSEVIKHHPDYFFRILSKEYIDQKFHLFNFVTSNNIKLLNVEEKNFEELIFSLESKYYKSGMKSIFEDFTVFSLLSNKSVHEISLIACRILKKKHPYSKCLEELSLYNGIELDKSIFKNILNTEDEELILKTIKRL